MAVSQCIRHLQSVKNQFSLQRGETSPHMTTQGGFRLGIRNLSKCSSLNRPSTPRASIFTSHILNSARPFTHATKNSATVPRPFSKPAVFGPHTLLARPLFQEQAICLYKARSNRAYIFGCYLIGMACISIGLFNYSTISWADRTAAKANRNLPSFSRASTVVSTLFLVSMGSYCLFFRVLHLKLRNCGKKLI